MATKPNIYLIGLSGTGKTRSGRRVAELLGWPFVEMDGVIEDRAGKPIPRIFEENGEDYFRDLESTILVEVADRGGRVVSTGGGVPLRPENRSTMKTSGLVIQLSADPETLHQRLITSAPQRGRTLRPLLGDDAPIDAIRNMLRDREEAYSIASVTIGTDHKSHDEVAEAIASAWRTSGVASTDADQENNLAAVVNTTQGSYRVIVGRDVIDDLGYELRKTGLKGRAFIVSDVVMFPSPVRRAQEALERGGYETHVLALEIGEATKNLETVQVVYEWLADLRADRSDIVVAMGGGVTGDLVGFAAATWLRGVALVQVPTSLAAMVDSSIGGKTGVNITKGKNLLGAFWQPKLVLQEIGHLDTLPAREMAAGWAEAVKHGFILDNRLLDTFERLAPQMKALEGDEPIAAIRRSVAIKGEIVSADEFETGDERILLNYGHTIGHAIEAISGYGTFLHGEAVAIGMMAAARIAESLGMIDKELVERQRRVLRSYDLPTSASGLNVDDLIEATKSDKKSRGGTIRWVLLEGPGKATTRRDVPDDIVREAVQSILN